MDSIERPAVAVWGGLHVVLHVITLIPPHTWPNWNFSVIYYLVPHNHTGNVEQLPLWQ